MDNAHFYKCISMYDDDDENEEDMVENEEDRNHQDNNQTVGSDFYCDEFIEKYPGFPFNRNDAKLYNYLYNMDINTVEGMSVAPLDIAYRATKDIQAGEEIFVDYGSAWEIAFNEYIHDMDAYKTCLYSNTVKSDEMCELCQKPSQFMFPMTFPRELFPSHWIGVQCIGDTCPER